MFLPIPTALPEPAALVGTACDAMRNGRLRPGDIVMDLSGGERGLGLAESATGLRRLHDCGFGLCLSDFGAGEASLELLRALPVDLVALTAELTADWTAPDGDRRTEAVRGALLGLLRELSVRIIATDLTARAEDLGVTLASGGEADVLAPASAAAAAVRAGRRR